jgi:hypothetical protein
MPTILNKTARPLRVPLPGGKLLRLAPRRSGAVAPKALKHPALLAMVESGDIEITEAGHSAGNISGGNRGLSSSKGHDPDKTMRRTGDG